MHGYGVLSWPDGTTFRGNFKEGKYHGQGECIYPDGRYMKGEYNNGVKNGFFTYKNSKNELYQCEYQQDKLKY